MPGLLDAVLPYVYSQGNRAKRGLNSLLSDPVGTFQQMVGDANDRAGQGLGLLSQSVDEGMNYGPATNKLAAMLAESYNPAGITTRSVPYWHNPQKPAKLDQFGQVRDASRQGSAEWAGTNTTAARAESLASEMRRILAEDWKSKDFDPSTVRPGLTQWAQDEGLNVGAVYRAFLREMNSTKDIPESAKLRINKAWIDGIGQQ